MKALVPWLLLAGCHQVFGVDAPADGASADATGVDGGNGCSALPALPPLDDEDRDGLPNGRDNCPRAANADQHDENANGIGDACDLCPATSESRDADCDGIGDVCDPDDTRADTRVFYGLAELTGLTVDAGGGATVSASDDQVLLAASLEGAYALFRADGGGITNGRYDTRFTIIDKFVPSYRLSLDISGEGSGYSVELLGGQGLRVERVPANVTPVQLGSAPLAETPDGTYDLVVEIEYPLLIVTLTGAVSTELTVQLDEQVFGPIQFGVRADECLAGVGYLAYTGALP